MKPRRSLTLVSLLAVWAFAQTAAWGQLPVISLESLFPPGGKIGTTLEVSVTGSDLDDPGELLFSHPGITASHKDGGTFLVTIAGNVEPGVYDARLRGYFGISNPRAFVAGQLTEVIEAGNNHSPATATEIQLESVVNGRTEADNYDHFKFSLPEGQRMLLHCQDQNIDSRLEASLALFSSDGTELARSRKGGVLDFTAPSDGSYTLQVYDFLYRGGNDYFYRLSVSTLPHIDFILPPSGEPGTKARYTLYGRNLPTGQPADAFSVDDQPLQKLIVEIELPADLDPRRSRSIMRHPNQTLLDGVEYRLPSPKGLSNPAFIGRATAPVIMETRSNEQPDLAQEVTVPCEYVGQFWPAQDVDWITFNASKGQVFIIELFSHRLGVPSHAFALLQKTSRNADGTVSASDVKEIYPSDENIGENRFNTGTHDPSWRFEVPEDASYRIRLVDLFNQSEDHPSRVYRLSIRHPQPDFRLVAMPDPFHKDKKVVLQESLAPRRGQTVPVKVVAFRKDDFNGPIEVRLQDPPPGLQCTSATLTGKETSATLLLTAAPDAAHWTGKLNFIGKASIDDAEVVREAFAAEVSWGIKDANRDPVQSRLTDELAASICDEPAPLVLSVPAGTALETSVAGKLSVPIQITRNAEFNEKLKIKPFGDNAVSKAKEIEIEGKADASEYELDLTQTKLAAGTYQLYFQTETKGKYRKNPEAVARAETAAKEAAQTLDSAKKAAGAAEELKQQAALESKLASERTTQAAQNLAAAETALKETENRIEELKKALAQAQTQLEETRQTRVAAARASEEAISKAKAAAENEQKALETAARTAAQAQEAEKARNEADQLAKAANDQSKPRDLTIPVFSTPFTIKVTPAPITVSVAPTVEVIPGAKVELPVSITRLYGFAAPVSVALVPPKESQGLSGQKATIDDGKTETRLSIEVAGDAPPGERTAAIEASLKLNGQDIKVTQPLTVRVAQAATEGSATPTENPKSE